MPTTLIVRDQTTTGELIHELSLEFINPETNAREILRSRLRQEVDDYNRKKPEYFRGLVQPTDAEKTLNGYRMENRRQIEWEPQFNKAVEAFEKNQILMIVNGEQVASLEEPITLTPETEVRFLRLVALVGG